MSICQRPSGSEKVAQAVSAASRHSDSRSAMRRAKRSSATRRATKLGLSAAALPDLILALLTGCYAQRGRHLPPKFSTGYRQAYPQFDPASRHRLFQRLPTGIAGPFGGCCMDSKAADAVADAQSAGAIQALVQDWGFARDQGRWDDLEALFHPDGEIAVSWFRG